MCVLCFSVGGGLRLAGASCASCAVVPPGAGQGERRKEAHTLCLYLDLKVVKQCLYAWLRTSMLGLTSLLCRQSSRRNQVNQTFLFFNKTLH